MQAQYRNLIEAARSVQARSHSPYSGFAVGAALLGASGRVYVGTNVENASFGLSICAERAAVCSAVAQGECAFAAIAITTSAARPTPPCGACRQVLFEFAPDLLVLLAGRDGTVEEWRLDALLPRAFATFREENPGGSGEAGGNP